MTPKKEKALAALLAAPTVKAAAQAAGITDSAYRRYKKDPEFMQEYRRRCTEMLDNATSSAKAAFPLPLNVCGELWKMIRRHRNSRLQPPERYSNTG